jgi:DNA invertase Pin-like site-specific DNA recombinase
VGVNVGYARCSTTSQDLTAQREQLTALGVPADRVYLDKGLTGTSRARPGLDQALAAVRDGDTFTVTKLDRLARSVPDALAILTQLSGRGVRFALGGSIYDWHDPMARMFLQILAVIAEFEGALIRQRTREGMTIARARGRLLGKPPSLAPAQDREIRRMHDSGDYPIAEIAAIFKVSRPTIYRALQRTTPGSANLPADTRPGLPSLDKYDQLLPSRQAASQSPSPSR